MDKLDQVLKDIELGRKIYIKQNHYGDRLVCKPLTRFGWPNRYIKLKPADIDIVREALSARRRHRA